MKLQMKLMDSPFSELRNISRVGVGTPHTAARAGGEADHETNGRGGIGHGASLHIIICRAEEKLII